MRRPGTIQLATIAIFIITLLYLAWLGYGALPQQEPTPTPEPALVFDGGSSLELARQQCTLGPRPTGSPAGWSNGDWIIGSLQEAGWDVEVQDFAWDDLPARNIIARAGQGPAIMVATYYDTRLVADEDPDPNLRNSPTLAGNASASGVAVLLELANTLDLDSLQNEVWLTFYDAEENGGIEGWEAMIGSRKLAEELERLPEATIHLAMVGDADQRFLRGDAANPTMQDQLWTLAVELGYADHFVPEQDTSPEAPTPILLQQGIPGVEMIDRKYLFRRTTADTCDKLDDESLLRIGTLLETYLEGDYLVRLLSTLAAENG